MRLLVMRHGPAEPCGAEGDAARRLSPDGREHTRVAAAALARILPAPKRIYTSPLLRARETAELLAAAFGMDAPVATPLLAPGFERKRIANELARANVEPLAIVGHEPDLSAFVGWLIGGGARIRLGKGAACLLEFAPPDNATLWALYPLDAFAHLPLDRTGE
ncbi:MAG: SixA phosphatase family protein [Gammaproteobacteria bacterium]